MTYDQAHRELWDRIAKSLIRIRRSKKATQKCLYEFDTKISIQNLKTEALQKGPALPTRRSGSIYGGCYGCEYAVRFSQETDSCKTCFIDWGVDITCLGLKSPYIEFYESFKAAKSRDDLLKVAKLARKIRDMPLHKWYIPIEIVSLLT